ncbi:hypothetical protein Nepgr_033127 [Nepenthes gracilis]|uniref:LOB domain-containing protein n=1 Tax=Nepenthes gracilis TaxID=150966 RepID=A0AAD3TLB9_NEPGR|nr:hypothetical protein Nepgr_033127 [Nepenthes gracilis]
MSGRPCGACKFLKRKCVKGCTFAPYFDSQQGTVNFAAVHRVFGASKASKLLLRVPAHRRLDAVVTLCYEALARVRDPVYGCVAHIFSLQQQVVTLQAELAYIEACLSTLQRHQLPPPTQPQTSPATSFDASAVHMPASGATGPVSMPTPHTTQLHQTSAAETVANFSSHESAHHRRCLSPEVEEDNGDLQALTREFASKYLPGVKFSPSTYS